MKRDPDLLDLSKVMSASSQAIIYFIQSCVHFVQWHLKSQSLEEALEQKSGHQSRVIHESRGVNLQVGFQLNLECLPDPL